MFALNRVPINWRVLQLGLLPLCIIMFGSVFKIFLFSRVHVIFANDSAELGTYLSLTNLLLLAASPGLGYASDKLGRRPVLVFSLACLTATAIILSFFPTLYRLTIVLYPLGIATPVARAAYCDVHITNKVTPNIINTFIAQAVPWILFYQLVFRSTLTFTLLISSSILFFILVVFWFRDREDHSPPIGFRRFNIKHETLIEIRWRTKHLCAS